MEIYKVFDKEFRIIFLNSVNSKNTYRQLNKIRKTVQEQNEKFNKEIETIKKKKTKKETQNRNPMLQNTVTKLKESIESFNNRLNQIEELVN